ncbi:MAG: methylated-DNA--[protein]-cysteine S-methyltransferase [Pseudomonadota bacterium]
MKHLKTLAFHPVHTPLGFLVLAASDNGLAGAWFAGQRHWPDALAAEFPFASPQRGGAGWNADPAHPVLARATQQVLDYFTGSRELFNLPLDLSAGTPFQQEVWQALLEIPRGKTSSYGALSANIGRPAAVRAVGGAIGRNPLSIIVPCHRVIGSAGSLTGYAGGLHRKTALLQLEGVL